MTFAPPETLFDEIIDFLISRPTPEEIIAFRVPETLDRRLQLLLDKNNHEGLNADEQDELNRFLQINHLLIMLTARARLKLMGEG